MEVRSGETTALSIDFQPGVMCLFDLHGLGGTTIAETAFTVFEDRESSEVMRLDAVR